MADNAAFRTTGPIAGSDTPILPSTLPLSAVRAALLEAGIPCHVSADAGGFLCNALLYHTLDACARLRPSSPAGFIHLSYQPC